MALDYFAPTSAPTLISALTINFVHSSLPHFQRHPFQEEADEKRMTVLRERGHQNQGGGVS